MKLNDQVPVVRNDDRVVLLSVREQRTRKKRVFYEFVYSDGAVVIYPRLDTRILTMGYASLTGLPTYCHPCRTEKAHIHYYSGEISCMCCGNKAGENDTRPSAAVLRGPWINVKKH